MNFYQSLSPSQETIIKHYFPESKSIEKLSELYYLFSDCTRLKILMSLCVAPMCVGDLSQILNVNQSTISHQLKLLKAYNLVDCERVKKNVNYRVVGDCVEKMIECGVDVKNSVG